MLLLLLSCPLIRNNKELQRRWDVETGRRKNIHLDARAPCTECGSNVLLRLGPRLLEHIRRDVVEELVDTAAGRMHLLVFAFFSPIWWDIHHVALQAHGDTDEFTQTSRHSAWFLMAGRDDSVR